MDCGAEVGIGIVKSCEFSMLGCISPHLTSSGKRGVFTGTSGLRIAYLSGCESPSGSGPAPKHCFTSADIQATTATLNTSAASYTGVDILLTSAWPKGITAYGNAPVSIALCVAKPLFSDERFPLVGEVIHIKDV